MCDYRSSLDKKIDDFYEKHIEKWTDERYYLTANKAITGTLKEFCEKGILSPLSLIHGLPTNPKERWCFRSESRKNKAEYDFWTGGTIDKMLSDIMEISVGAVNNNKTYDFCKSFSKSLAVPLFKYTKDNPVLIIAKKRLNTLQVTFELQYFDWCSVDNRYGEEEFETTISINSLCSKEALKNELWKVLQDEFFDAYSETDEQGNRFFYMDIDEIDFCITGYTIDVSNWDRPTIDEYCSEHEMPKVKRHASYRKDREVLSTALEDCLTKESICYRVENTKLVDLFRFLYLLAISDEEEAYKKVCQSCFWKGIEGFIHEDAKAIQWFIKYMEENLRYEKDSYCELFEGLRNVFNLESVKSRLEEFRKEGVCKENIAEIVYQQYLDLL